MTKKPIPTGRLRVKDIKKMIQNLDDSCWFTTFYDGAEVVQEADTKIWSRDKNGNPTEFIIFLNSPD